MDPRQLQEIMSQGAVRPETARDRRERAALDADLRESPVAGKPLHRRLRNFQIGADAYLGALGGPLPWMRRLREIELLTDAHATALGERWRELAAEHRGRPDAFAHAWRDEADRWSFAEVNELVERHNRHFPAEARLPMDPRTRDFVLIDGKPYTREPLGPEWILGRFPAELARAAA
jgi:hypothetical protein